LLPFEKTEGVAEMDWLALSFFLIGLCVLLLSGLGLEKYLHWRHRQKHAH